MNPPFSLFLGDDIKKPRSKTQTFFFFLFSTHHSLSSIPSFIHPLIKVAVSCLFSVDVGDMGSNDHVQRKDGERSMDER
jgi:hypothetical protein